VVNVFSIENMFKLRASLRQGSLFPDSRQGLEARSLEITAVV